LDFDDDEIIVNSVHVDIGPALNFPDVQPEKGKKDFDKGQIRAQIDTGAFVTCTDRKDMLHGYKEFTSKRPCPVRLLPATVNSDCVPKGYGYLHVPANNVNRFLAVRAFYTPALRTTVIDERDLIQAAGHSPKDIESENIKKFYDAGTFTYHAAHKMKRSFDVVVHGVLRNGKCYTNELIPPYSDDTKDQVLADDPEFQDDCTNASLLHVYAFQENAMSKLQSDLEDMPRNIMKLPFHEYIQENTPVQAIRQETERLLWHQRLGHTSDYYLYNAHQHVKGVPQFKHMDKVLDTCPTCIRAKQKKEPAGSNSTRTATLLQ
jgi:hypothetical protein